MTEPVRERIPGAGVGGLRSGADIVELELLLSTRMAVALESAASRRGLSMGQIMRRVVRDFLTAANEGRLASPPCGFNLLRERPQ